jgi:iron complex transport system ATP-binding protein
MIAARLVAQAVERPVTRSAPALEARAVSVQRGRRFVLDSVHLALAAGELTAIVGPNGAGKSTLLSVLSGDEVPAHGEVRMGPVPLHSLSPLARAQRRAMLPQHASLAFDLPVIDVVRMGRTPFGDREPAATRIADAALAAVELASRRERSYLQLSGGEQQRVQLARFLAQLWPNEAAAEVGLLDEPVASLDPRQQQRTMSLLRHLSRSGRAVAVILHDLVLASRYADRVVVVRDGCILAADHPTRALTSRVLEAAFDTPFEIGYDADGRPVPLPHGMPSDSFAFGGR